MLSQARLRLCPWSVSNFPQRPGSFSLSAIPSYSYLLVLLKVAQSRVGYSSLVYVTALRLQSASNYSPGFTWEGLLLGTSQNCL